MWPTAYVFRNGLSDSTWALLGYVEDVAMLEKRQGFGLKEFQMQEAG